MVRCSLLISKRSAHIDKMNKPESFWAGLKEYIFARMPDPEERYEMGLGEEVAPAPKPKKEIDNPEAFLKALFPPSTFDNWEVKWWQHWQDPVLVAQISLPDGKDARLTIGYFFENRSFEIIFIWPKELGDLGSRLAFEEDNAYAIWDGLVFPEDLEKYAPEIKQIIQTIGNKSKMSSSYKKSSISRLYKINLSKRDFTKHAEELTFAPEEVGLPKTPWEKARASRGRAHEAYRHLQQAASKFDIEKFKREFVPKLLATYNEQAKNAGLPSLKREWLDIAGKAKGGAKAPKEFFVKYRTKLQPRMFPGDPIRAQKAYDLLLKELDKAPYIMSGPISGILSHEMGHIRGYGEEPEVAIRSRKPMVGKELRPAVDTALNEAIASWNGFRAAWKAWGKYGIPHKAWSAWVGFPTYTSPMNEAQLKELINNLKKLDAKYPGISDQATKALYEYDKYIEPVLYNVPGFDWTDEEKAALKKFLKSRGGEYRETLPLLPEHRLRHLKRQPYVVREQEYPTRVASLSKRAAEYIDKKEEESGNITYIYSDKHIKKRNKRKAKKVMKLAELIKDLKAQVVKDLKDDGLRTPALAVALIINTYERVGNPQSSEERDTYGVTTWKKKHISFSNGTAKIKYKGKAGVKQDKEVKPAYLVKELKELTKDLKPNDEIFPDLTSNDVNKYLKKFKITAKDIRGFFANQEMIKALKKLKTTDNEKLRKERFKKALEQTAKIVGHNAGTLKNQYLIPAIEENYVVNNKIEMGMQTKASLQTSILISKRAEDPLPHLLISEEERQSRKEYKEQMAKAVLEIYFPFIPITSFGGWEVSGTLRGPKTGGLWREASFEARLPLPDIEAPDLRLFLHMGPYGQEKSLGFAWDASLGDFGTGFIGDPIVIRLFGDEIEKNAPMLLDIVERMGVESESQKGLHERGITEYKPKPTGVVPDVDFTEIFPKELFKNFIIASYEPHDLNVQLPPVTNEPYEPFFYIRLEFREGGIRINFRADKMTDPKMQAACKGKTYGMKRIDRMDKFNELIEPIKNTIANMSARIDEIKEERGGQLTEEITELVGNQRFQISKRAATIEEIMRTKQPEFTPSAPTPEPGPTVTYIRDVQGFPNYKIYSYGPDFMLEGPLYKTIFTRKDYPIVNAEVKRREDIFGSIPWHDPTRPYAIQMPGMEISFSSGQMKAQQIPISRELGSTAEKFLHLGEKSGSEVTPALLVAIRETIRKFFRSESLKVWDPSEADLFNWAKRLTNTGRIELPVSTPSGEQIETETMQSALRPYLNTVLPIKLAVRGRRYKDKVILETYDRTIEGVEQEKPHHGQWVHILNKKVDDLKQYIESFMQIDGEISVSEIQDQHFLMRQYYLALILEGTPTQLYLQDVGTRVDDWTGRRIQSAGVPKGAERTEGFLVPSKSKLVGIITDTRKYMEQAEQLGYKVYTPSDFVTDPHARVSTILKQLAVPFDAPFGPDAVTYVLTAIEETASRQGFLTPAIIEWIRDNDGQIPGGGQLSETPALFKSKREEEESGQWENDFWDKNGGIMVTFPHSPSRPPKEKNIRIRRLSGSPSTVNIQEFPIPQALLLKNKIISDSRLRRLVTQHGQPIVIDKREGKVRTTPKGFELLNMFIESPPAPLQRWSDQILQLSKRARHDIFAI